MRSPNASSAPLCVLARLAWPHTPFARRPALWDFFVFRAFLWDLWDNGGRVPGKATASGLAYAACDASLNATNPAPRGPDTGPRIPLLGISPSLADFLRDARDKWGGVSGRRIPDSDSRSCVHQRPTSSHSAAPINSSVKSHAIFAVKNSQVTRAYFAENKEVHQKLAATIYLTHKHLSATLLLVRGK